jgi:hypothetical protein
MLTHESAQFYGLLLYIVPIAGLVSLIQVLHLAIQRLLSTKRAKVVNSVLSVGDKPPKVQSKQGRSCVNVYDAPLSLTSC